MNQDIDDIKGRQVGLALAICAIARQLRPEQAVHVASWLHDARKEEASSDAATEWSEAFEHGLDAALMEVHTALSLACGS
jgi:hypothetical protein